ncbi:hypothetical protein SPRG_00519, partial [Saprolegnia parasitica CBS 223.65]
MTATLGGLSLPGDDPNYFPKLVDQQSPEFLWTGLRGNIVNQVISTDLNYLSVIEYAVKFLKVKHIIVCTKCGGVNAALSQEEFGLVDNWLRSIKDLYIENARKFLGSNPDYDGR